MNDGPGSMVGGELLIIYSNTNLNMQGKTKQGWREKQEIKNFPHIHLKKPSGLTGLHIFFSNLLENNLFPLCLVGL